MSFKYYDLKEARLEIKKRFENVELKESIKKYLDANFINHFDSDVPKSVIWRSMLTPDNGFDFYLQSSAYLGCEPLCFQYLKDKFVSINDDKKALSDIKLIYDKNKYYQTRIVNFNEWDGKKILDVDLNFTNQKLHEFHQSLFDKFFPDIDLIDLSDWCSKFEGAKDYYFYYLLHFIAHGVLFEAFFEENEPGDVYFKFEEEIIDPALKKIKEIFGLDPIVVQIYPFDQSAAEDLHWFTYPKYINNYLLEYFKSNNVKLKEKNI